MCLNLGTCVAPDICDCDTSGGYYGKNCASFNCSLITCKQNTKCVGPNACDCSKTGGYYGPDCSQFNCLGSPCINGTCIAPDKCLYNCSIPCKNNSACVGHNICNCSGGYYGPDCSQFDCNSSQCLNGGKCIAPDVCDCSGTGYTGNQCENGSGTGTGTGSMETTGSVSSTTQESSTTTKPTHGSTTEETHKQSEAPYRVWSKFLIILLLSGLATIFSS